MPAASAVPPVTSSKPIAGSRAAWPGAAGWSRAVRRAAGQVAGPAARRAGCASWRNARTAAPPCPASRNPASSGASPGQSGSSASSRSGPAARQERPKAARRDAARQGPRRLPPAGGSGWCTAWSARPACRPARCNASSASARPASRYSRNSGRAPVRQRRRRHGARTTRPELEILPPGRVQQRQRVVRQGGQVQRAVAAASIQPATAWPRHAYQAQPIHSCSAK